MTNLDDVFVLFLPHKRMRSFACAEKRLRVAYCRCDKFSDDFVVAGQPKLPLQSVKQAAGVFTYLDCSGHEL